MNFDPTGSDYPLYNTMLAEARRREKRMMFINCSKLGALLILYNIFNYLLRYPYYVLAASLHSGSLIPLPNDALEYLRENPDFAKSTAFSMGGNLFIFFVSVVLLLITAKLAFRVDISDMMRPKLSHIPEGLRWMPMCLFINIAIAMLVTILQNYLSTFGVTIPESDFSISTPTTAALVMQFLYVIVMGPIGEEIVYRGIVLTLLKPFGKWLAVLISALIFGLMHGNIPQMASASASAVVTGIIAVQCGSIVPTIVIHICNNFIASYDDFADAMGWAYADEIQMALYIVLLFAGGFVIFAYSYRLKIKEEQYAMTAGQRFAQVFLNIPMMIYFCYLLAMMIKGIVKAN